ncbi:MAG: hypothetical protein LCH46_02050 [Proteobacteria bacterium]|nr:hypothetical protein [Pseudomonadota bacterium]
MLIQGFPISLDLPSDPELQDRFWYWQGASGRKYIHSVYALEHCPPLPGAVYVGVRRQGPLRTAVCTGRFTPYWDGAVSSHELACLAGQGVDEVHVHLLAKAPGQAEAVLADLKDAMLDVTEDFGSLRQEAATHLARVA